MKPTPKNATFAPESVSKQDAKKAARTARIQERAAKQMSRLLDSQKNRPPPEMPIYGKPPKISPEERATQLNDLKSKIEANKGRETAIPSKKDAEMAATNSLAPKTPPPPVNTPPVSGGNYLDNEIKSGVNAMPNAAMNAGLGVAKNAGLGTAMSNPAGFGATAGNIAATAGNKFMKKGGSVRNKPAAKFSSGGSTSKASSRGDGIAQRGKTKGRYI